MLSLKGFISSFKYFFIARRVEGIFCWDILLYGFLFRRQWWSFARSFAWIGLLFIKWRPVSDVGRRDKSPSLTPNGTSRDFSASVGPARWGEAHAQYGHVGVAHALQHAPRCAMNLINWFLNKYLTRLSLSSSSKSICVESKFFHKTFQPSLRRKIIPTSCGTPWIIILNIFDV